MKEATSELLDAMSVSGVSFSLSFVNLTTKEGK